MNKFWVVLFLGAVSFEHVDLSFAQGKVPPQKEVSKTTPAFQAELPCGSAQDGPVVPVLPDLTQGISKLTLEAAKQNFDQGKAVFVDARSPLSFETRRIKGARNCSLGSLEFQIKALKEKVPVSTRLIVYCAGETCTLSQKVAEKLREQGYCDVLIFPGGWQSWMAAGFPVEP